MKKVTVITPCYNSEKYLGECLESLEKQTIGMENLEIILVNDASTDSTWKMILEFEKRYPESVIAIDLPENCRQGGARNEGLKYATGEYIAFLDSDDTALPQAYEEVYQKAKEVDADIVQFNHYDCNSNREEVCDNCKIEGILDLKDREIRKMFLMAEVLTMNHCSKLYRRNMLEESNASFAEHRIYEEPAFVYPQMFFAKRIYSMKEVLYRVRMNEQSTMHCEAKKSERLIDHPEVQMQVLQYMLAHKKIMSEYYDEIEYYFLKTYYVETLFFAGQGNMILDIEYFKKMQKNITQLFPKWEQNIYLQDEKMKDVVKVLKTVTQHYEQSELVELCTTVYKKIK